MGNTGYGYLIRPRSEELGGGFSLHLLEGDKEVGGGVFPLEAGADRENALRDALAEATEEGEKWYESRGGEP